MATNTSAETQLKQRVAYEQIGILFQRSPLTLTTNFLVASVLTYSLWNIFQHEVLLGWWLVNTFSILLRLALMLVYRHRRAHSHTVWQRLMTGGAIISGIIWGAAGVLFFAPHSATALITVTIILAGMTAGSVSSHSSWLPAQFSYAILAMAPISLNYLYAGGELQALGYLCLIYLATILMFARQLSHTLIKCIHLQLERRELVHQLRCEMEATKLARTRAVEANRAKSKFLAAICHDLRQPIHAQSVYLNVLENSDLSAKQQKITAGIRTAAASAGEMLNTLLDFSRIEAGAITANISDIRLQPLLNKIENEFMPQANACNLAYRSRETSLTVRSDQALLEIILRNLLSNAIRYTNRGGILLACRRRGDFAMLEVYDTGIGIEASQQKEIYQEFHQLGNPKHGKGQGFGLGLSIVEGLSHTLGHTLSLNSKPGHGSVFRLLIPIAR